MGNRKKLIKICIICAAVIFCFPLFFALVPFPELKEFLNQEYSTAFYDSDGKLIQISSLDNGSRKEYTQIKDIPVAVQKIFLKAEDRRFYFHNGVDYPAILLSTIVNLKQKKIVRGGSTISMQLVKSIRKNNETTITRKIKDFFYAHVLEAKLSKKKILELYLNNIYFGRGAIGITSAARVFYGKELEGLSPQEICYLALLPRNPSFYDPILHPQRATERAFLLFKECDRGRVSVTKNKADRGQTSITDFEIYRPTAIFEYPFEAPHYIRYVQTTMKQAMGTDLEQTTGTKGTDLKKNLPSKVNLSINLELQNYALRLLHDGLLEAQDSRIANASLLMIENKTGKPLVWIGNSDFFDQENAGQIDGVLVKNQPGSSMKPFLYALALESKDEKGQPLFHPNSILADIPMEFGDEKLYIPSNFNNRYNGPVRFRIALASSLNVPAVYILDKVGVPSYLKKLDELGFSSLKKTGEQADLGLALGAGEVTLKELVEAFAIFTRDGKDFSGNQIYEQDTVRILDSILSDKAARALGFGYSQTFQTDYPSIFKTGTSNQYQNIIALGATKDYTIGVWMGNFNGQTVVGKTGSSLPAWVAKNLLDYVYGGRTDYKTLAFPEPENWKLTEICPLSGLPAGKNCPSTVYEYFSIDDLNLSENENYTCSWHKEIDGELQIFYPPEYQQWARKTKNGLQIDYKAASLYIQSPKNDSLFYSSQLNKEKQAISVEVFGGESDSLEIYYDHSYLKTINRPFAFQLPVEQGRHICEVICGSESDQITYSVK